MAGVNLRIAGALPGFFTDGGRLLVILTLMESLVR
jgi:hypothetical protein